MATPTKRQNVEAVGRQSIGLRKVAAALDPTRPVRGEPNHYCQRPDNLSAAIAGSLDLFPETSHLVLGPIGCGKSTELLAAGRVLLGAPGRFPRYIELSTKADISASDGLGLLAVMVEDLTTELRSRFPDDDATRELEEKLKPWTEGYHDPYINAPFADDDSAFVEAVVKRPKRVPEEFGVVAELMGGCAEAVGRLMGGRLVWLIDGLDRVELADFETKVKPVAEVLRSLQIGHAVVAPRMVVTGLERVGLPADFEEFHVVGPLQVDRTAEREFLLDVLRQRGVMDHASASAQMAIVEASGGVLRHLVQLAKGAVQAAYVAGSQKIETDHVEVARDRLGRTLLYGVNDDELRLLQVLQTQGTFAPRSDTDHALVATCRVLEYAGKGAPRRIIHPALRPFIDAAAAALAPDSR